MKLRRHLPQVLSLGTSSVLDRIASLAVIAASATFIWYVVKPTTIIRTGTAEGSRSEPPLPKDSQSLEGAILAGTSAAKVALIEYSDFQCPFCGRFAREVQPTLMTRYVETGKIRWAFRQHPLVNHNRAAPAALAAICAAEQQRFWPMHDKLFQHQQDLRDSDLVADAVAVGADKGRFQGCLGLPSTRAALEADLANARQVTIGGTPTFLLGVINNDGRVTIRKRLSGVQPLEAFTKSFDEVLQTAGVSAK